MLLDNENRINPKLYPILEYHGNEKITNLKLGTSLGSVIIGAAFESPICIIVSLAVSILGLTHWVVVKTNVLFSETTLSKYVFTKLAISAAITVVTIVAMVGLSNLYLLTLPEFLLLSGIFMSATCIELMYEGYLYYYGTTFMEAALAHRIGSD